MRPPPIACLAIYVLRGVLGCGSGDGAPPVNRPPIIDSFEGPDRVVTSDGRASLLVSIAYHDDDNDVVAIVLRVPASNTEMRTSASPRRSAAARLSLLLGGTKGASVDYEVVVVDSLGAESTPAKGRVLLE